MVSHAPGSGSGLLPEPVAWPSFCRSCAQYPRPRALRIFARSTSTQTAKQVRAAKAPLPKRICRTAAPCLLRPCPKPCEVRVLYRFWLRWESFRASADATPESMRTQPKASGRAKVNVASSARAAVHCRSDVSLAKGAGFLSRSGEAKPENPCGPPTAGPSQPSGPAPSASPPLLVWCNRSPKANICCALHGLGWP